MGNIKLLNIKKNAFYRSRISKIFPQCFYVFNAHCFISYNKCHTVFVMSRNKLQRTCLFLIVKKTEKVISVKCQNAIKHLTFDTMLLTPYKIFFQKNKNTNFFDSSVNILINTRFRLLYVARFNVPYVILF